MSRRARPRLLLLIHGLLLVLLLALFIVLDRTGPESDANIGAGLVGLLLLGLGLPWSLLRLLIDSGTYEDFPRVVRVLLTFGPAVFNVGVHALFVAALVRRRRADRSATYRRGLSRRA